jgi:single-strand DNA-binding protein
MAAVNKVILIGNMGKDPEVRMTPNGTKVASFSLATTERFNDAQGNRQERTEWHNIVAWSRLAEILEQYTKKGSPIFIEGRLQTRNWDDANGVKHYRTEVVATSIQMLGGKDNQGGGGNYGGQSGYSAPQSNYGAAPSGQGAPNAAAPSGPDSYGNSAPAPDDDLPF